MANCDIVSSSAQCLRSHATIWSRHLAANTPSQSDDLPLKECHVTAGVLVDDSLVADVLGSACKLQRA